MTWDTNGLYSTPADGLAIADTGALAAGTYSFTIWISTAVPLGNEAVKIEHRNAANNASLKTHYVFMDGPGTVELRLPNLTLALNERVRAAMYYSYIGLINVSIHTE